MPTVRSWVQGDILDSAGETLVVTGPLERAVVATLVEATDTGVDRAVRSARDAFAGWRDRSPEDRGRLLLAMARQLRERADEFVAVEIAETGKLEGEMRSSLDIAASYFEYYGGVVRALFGDTIGLGAGDHAFTTHEPYGVVAMITPWNGPLTQAARGISAALAAGNTVVIKPSEFTPSTTVMLAQVASEVGVPAGVLNVVLGRGDRVGGALVAHPAVRLVAFTGSVTTGRAIARAAAERLLPVILELGGKSANLVFEDADLELAVEQVLTVCTSAGQQCAALSRLLVQDSVHNEMVERVGRAMAARTPGTRLASITTEAQFDKVLRYFDIAEAEGARLVTGGRAVDGLLARGRYVLPTLYAGVTPDMTVFREEIFGPVLTATPFTDEAEAIALANDSEYGLVASVWTKDIARALRVASRIEAGQVMVNGGRTGIETPFGGYKASGIGREKGFESLRHYTQLKTTVVSTR